MASVLGANASYSGYVPRPSARGGAAPTSLATLIQSEIIPRLVLAHDRDACPGPTIDQQEIDGFAPLVLSADTALLFARVERLLARGISAERIMVDLLAPTARQLGIWWEDDRCDFVEVTMGLWRLQEVVRELAAAVPPMGFATTPSRTALFAAMPEDQHGFGAICIGEVFRLNGWDAEIVVGASMAELLDEVAGRHFDIFGLTVGCDCHSSRLPSTIHALRSVSRNGRLRVLVGGRVFVEDPGLAMRVGADGTAPDALAALDLAERLVTALDPSTACY